MAAKPNDPIGMRISAARLARNELQDYINGYYDLALPLRTRIGESDKSQRDRTKRADDIFDDTLQQAVDDFSSYQQDLFVPDYRPWVRGVPGIDLPNDPATKSNFKDAYKRWEERLYALIARTDFYENQHEIFAEVPGAAGGILIPHNTRIDQTVRTQPIMMASLLFDEGPHRDLDGRWMETSARKKHLDDMFEGLELKSHSAVRSASDETTIRVVQGCHRDWSAEGGPRWRWVIRLNNKTVHDKALSANAPPPVIVARWRSNPPYAWGPGPAVHALPSARGLDMLSYLHLKKLGKEVDPPHWYEADGVFNPEGGVHAGTYIGGKPGSKPPVPLIEPTSSANVFFEREKMEMRVRRALYIEDVQPAGKTPPTATQVIEQVARQQRRQQARRRIYREYVLPCLQRFVYIFSARGELEPIEIGGRQVDVRFETPVSKASDADEVAAGLNLVTSAVGAFGEAAAAEIDVKATMMNWQERLGDKTIVFREQDGQ